MTDYKSTNITVFIPMQRGRANVCAGYFSCSPDAYDLAIDTYLPTSPVRLRAIVAEVAGIDDTISLSHLANVSVMLIVLADLNGWQ